jgi:hypothetical protein
MSFPDLVTPVYEAAKKRIKLMPQNSNRASSLGGDCLRELVYGRISWDKASPHGVDLQLIFDEGGYHEKQVLRALEEAGLTLIEQQVALSWPEYGITGHIDALVVWLMRSFPLDVKSMSEHIFNSIAFRGPGVYQWSEVADKFQAKPWLRKYFGQLTLYALMKNVEWAILLCKNKSTGALAQVNIEVDYAYGETLLKKAEEINRHVAAGTLPDRIPWGEGDICSRCRFLGECLPDRAGKDPLQFVEDDALEDLLGARHDQESAGRDFDRLDKRIKSIIKARPESKFVVGNFLIQKSGTDRVVVKIEKVSS